VLEKFRLVFANLGSIKNLFSFFVSIGNKFGGEELRKKVFMTPTQMYNNIIEYLQISAFKYTGATMSFDISGAYEGGLDDNDFKERFWMVLCKDTDKIAPRVKPSTKLEDLEKRVDDIENNVQRIEGKINNADTQITNLEKSGIKTDTDIISIRNDIKSALADIGALKLSDLNRTGEVSRLTGNNKYLIGRIEGLEKQAKAILTQLNSIQPIQLSEIEEASREAAEEMAERHNINNKTPTQAMYDHFKQEYDLVFKPDHVFGQNFSLAEDRIMSNWENQFIKNNSYIGKYEGGDDENITVDFHLERQYFPLLMKSITAKIFTVVGMYDVMDRPAEYSGITPMRMILGGADDLPKVNDKALALYLRLPLLCQFYQKLFDMSKQEDGNNPLRDPGTTKTKTVQIAMVPELEGVFSELIKLTFLKSPGSPSHFTDNEVCDVIRECNHIYQHFAAKYPENTTMKIIEEFVLEINRRYGIINKDQADKYNKMLYERDNYRHNESKDPYETSTGYSLQYPLLPGEEDDEPVRLSNAEKLLGNKFGANYKKNPFTIDYMHKELLDKFRCRIEETLTGDSNHFDFNKAIKLVSNKIRNEPNDEERFKIVASLVRGKDAINSVDRMKYLMFHETVIVGLNTLSAIHSILSKFKTVCAGIKDFMDTGNPLNNNIINVFINILNLINSQGLIVVQVDSDGININYNKLDETVQSLFDHVSQFIEILRPHFKQEFLDKYILKIEGGSLYWLQEQLNEKLLKKNAIHYDDTGAREEYFNLEKCVKVCNEAYNAMKKVSCGDILAELIYYKADNAGKGLTNTSPTKIDLRANSYDALLVKTEGNNRIIDLKYLHRYTELYAWDNKLKTSPDSLMCMFNQYISKYIMCCYDTGLSKIYGGLLNNFVSSIFNRAINDYTYTFPDIGMATGKGGAKTKYPGIGKIELVDYKYIDEIVDKFSTAPIGAAQIELSNVSNTDLTDIADPTQGQVLYASLAKIISNLVSSKTTTGTPLYIIDNPADLPIYMKEKLRANLPVFINLFQELINKIEFISKLVSQNTVDCTKTNQNGSKIPAKFTLEAETTDSKQNNKRFLTIMESIVIGSRAFIASCEQTLKDIGNAASFFEMSQNFAKEFKAQNHVEPFMPLSSILYHLKSIDINEFLPVSSVGMDKFKYLYGTRGLLQEWIKKPLLENAPGIMSICEKYNMSVDIRAKCDKTMMESFMKSVVELNRYLYDTRHIKTHCGMPKLTSYSLISLNSMIDNTSDISLITTRIAYQLEVDLQDVIRLTENSIPEDSIKKIVSKLSSDNIPTGNLELQNILDLNIVPINVHALMREIPLVNLYNYSYTFDMLMMEYFYNGNLEGQENAQRIGTNRAKLCEYATNMRFMTSKDAYVALMLEPYRELKEDNEKDLFRGMMNGDANSKELGRPKFLSDQLYNKVLLSSVYTGIIHAQSGTVNISNGDYITYMDAITTKVKTLVKSEDIPVVIQAIIDFGDDTKGFNLLMSNKKIIKTASMGTLEHKDIKLPTYGFTPNPGKTIMRNTVNTSVNVPNAPERMDTTIVRNLIFTTNLFRMVRMKLHRDLVFSRDIVLRSAQVTRPQLTEFRENEIDVSRPEYKRRI
jgi:chaperonin cofactor prefoldin